MPITGVWEGKWQSAQDIAKMKKTKIIDKQLKDSGGRREFKTGAVRDVVDGKGRMDLLPVRALLSLAKHFEKGAKKYSDRNWEKGQPLSVYYDSSVRHLIKWWGGATDEDHLTAFVWNAICLLETKERIDNGFLPKELNDMPERVFNDDEF